MTDLIRDALDRPRRPKRWTTGQPTPAPSARPASPHGSVDAGVRGDAIPRQRDMNEIIRGAFRRRYEE